MDKITLSISQIDKMKHAIGYERRKVKRGVYEAYRNYYSVTGENSDWEQLYDLGMAFICPQEKMTFYGLTEAGFDTLEKILDVKIKRSECD